VIEHTERERVQTFTLLDNAPSTVEMHAGQMIFRRASLPSAFHNIRRGYSASFSFLRISSSCHIAFLDSPPSPRVLDGDDLQTNTNILHATLQRVTTHPFP
jgi:hypothetical protein